VDAVAEALLVLREIEETAPGTPVVAIGRDVTQQVLLELMRVGVWEVLPAPYQADDMLALANRLEEHLARNPLRFDATDMLFSFLPAKPGVGTSTLALNLSVALARCQNRDTLLMDFDLYSGLIAFMLKLNCPYSVVDALVRSEELDENLWPQLTCQAEGLHVLASGRPGMSADVQSAQIQRLVSFARHQYGIICVDLSGNMEKYSIELMQESKRIFLVTTPEIPPLHLARERYEFLRGMDLGDRVSILLNRWTKKNAISVAQIEELLEIPVYDSFPNNYNGVHQALVAGRPVDANSDLGKRFAALARRVMDPGGVEKPRKKKSFLETFSVLPEKYSLSR
jgi:pilus assembly protein CpaE